MPRLTIGRSLLAAIALAACSSAGKGSAASSETTGTRHPGSAARVPATTRPDTLQRSEPSRLEMPPVLPAAHDTGTGDRADITRLERDARALAHTAGCSTAAQCRTAPVGAKACGGPRTWLVYCAATTDTVRLMRALRELERVEKAWNARAGVMSTCEMRLPPTPTLTGGSCREGGAPP